LFEQYNVDSYWGRIDEQELFWLSDEQWARIEPHLPRDVRGVERADDRRVISGIMHVLRCGCRWCDCPCAATNLTL
jgi:transposase